MPRSGLVLLRKGGRSYAVVYLLLVALCAVVLFPIVWMVLTSLKQTTEIYTVPPRVLPSSPTVRHYGTVFGDPRMVRYFLNSCLISGTTTLASVFAGMFAAYAFSRFRFRLKKPLYLFVIGTRMLPAMVVVLPLYMMLTRIRLADSYLGVILAHMAVTLPLSIWLLRGFIDRVPIELDQAAMVDGCSRLRIMLSVLLPLVAPAILAVSVYVFLESWNEFLLALVLTNSERVRPISVGLTMYLGEYQTDWGALMAASTAMTIPPMIIYAVFHRKFTYGLAQGAVKS